MIKEVIGIQYLRGVAASIVVLHHLFSTKGLEYLFMPRLGDFGVDIFFVISGFIMWHTTTDSAVGVLEFWRRRVIRVVPLYWIFLSAMVIAALLAPASFNSTVITPDNVVKSFLFIPHYHAVQNIIAPILIPGWSLNYEMFFYFLFGFALLTPSRPRRAVFLSALLVGLTLLGLIVQPTDPVAATYTSSGLLKFFDGIVLAMIYRSGWLNGTALGLGLISAGLLSRFVSVSSDFGMVDSFVGLSPALIVAGTLALEPAVRRAPSLVFLTIGNASYSIYLSHLFFLRLSELGWRRLDFMGVNGVLDATYVTLALAFAIVGGIVIYFVVERPTLSLLQKRRVPVSAKAA